jgi:hypothetical protein
MNLPGGHNALLTERAAKDAADSRRCRCWLPPDSTHGVNA